jgi:hypothetical protein
LIFVTVAERLAAPVGDPLGDADGQLEGLLLGELDGDVDGEDEGELEGDVDGDDDGEFDGDVDGEDDGEPGVCGPAVDRVKSANSSVVVLLGLQEVSWPPWKVEKNTPELAPGIGSVCWQTFLPSLQTVIEPVVMFTNCSIECQLPSAGKVQLPRQRSAPNPEPDAV